MHDDDIPRFAQLNITADTQINWGTEEFPIETETDSTDAAARGSDIDEADDELTEWDQMRKLLLANNESDMNALPELYKTGARIVLSSDWDVSSIDPLVSIHNAFYEFEGAVPRDEVVAFAVKAYTLNAAYLMKHEDMTGSVEVGKYADLVVLNRNIFEVPPDTIRDTKVVWTLLEGSETYRSEDFEAKKQRSRNEDH